MSRSLPLFAFVVGIAFANPLQASVVIVDPSQEFALESALLPDLEALGREQTAAQLEAGIAALGRGEDEEALQRLGDAVELARQRAQRTDRAEDWQILAACEELLGQGASAADEIDQALRAFERAAEICIRQHEREPEEGRWFQFIAAVQQQQAGVFLVQGRIAEARESLEQARDWRMRGSELVDEGAPDPSSVAATDLLIAQTFLREENLDQALEVLGRALNRCQELVEGAGDDEMLRRSEWASCLHQRGELLLNLGRVDPALEDFRTELKQFELVAEANPNSLQHWTEWISGQQQLAQLLLRLERREEALDMLADSLGVAESFRIANPGLLGSKLEIGALNQVAVVQRSLGLRKEALETIAGTLTLFDELLRRADVEPRWLIGAAKCHEAVAALQFERREGALGLEAMARAEGLYEQLVNRAPESPSWLEQGRFLQRLAQFQFALERPELGMESLNQAGQLFADQTKASEGPVQLAWKQLELMTRQQRAEALVSLGAVEDALGDYRLLAAGYRQLVAESSGESDSEGADPKLSWWRKLATVEEAQGELLARSQRYGEAAEAFTRAFDLCRALETALPEDPQWSVFALGYQERVGNMRLAANQAELALEQFTEGQEGTDSLLSDYPDNAGLISYTAIFRERVGQAQAALGHEDLAIAAWREAIALYQAQLNSHPEDSSAQQRLERCRARLELIDPSGN